MSSQKELIGELLCNAIGKLNQELEFFTNEDAQNTEFIKAFNMESLLSDIPLELFEQNDIEDYQFMSQVGAAKLNKLSNELHISQLDKNINTFKNINSTLENKISFLKSGLMKYVDGYEKSKETEHDFLDISLLQTTIEQLQMTIHEANNQEHYTDIVKKLKTCFDMKKKIDEYKVTKETVLREIQKYRLLPPDIREAEKKLQELEQKYQELSRKFSTVFQNNS